MDDSKLESISEPDRTAYRQLIIRCQKSGIQYRLELMDKAGLGYLMMYLPSGRETRGVFVIDHDIAGKLGEIQFEKYTFVPHYQAICRYDEGWIEAYVRFLRPTNREMLFSKLLGIPYSELRKRKGEDIVFELRNDSGDRNNLVVALGHPSNIILPLTWREADEASGLTLKIAGLQISTSEQSVNTLEKLANSLFFEIQTIKDIPLMLENYREPYKRLSPPRRELALRFPKYQYDGDALNLYWYAMSAHQMPLLQYLAYYQVLEFYFPFYSRREAQSELANILKDPQFDPNHHVDISRIVSVLQARLGRGYANEKEQLTAAIKGSVQEKEIRDLLELEDLKNYFATDGKAVCPVRLSIDSKVSDIRGELAARLYDIRCSIVHTKAEETDKRRIIPFSEEEALLGHEIPVIEFLARKAIIAMSKRLTI